MVVFPLARSEVLKALIVHTSAGSQHEVDSLAGISMFSSFRPRDRSPPRSGKPVFPTLKVLRQAGRRVPRGRGVSAGVIGEQVPEAPACRGSAVGPAPVGGRPQAGVRIPPKALRIVTGLRVPLFVCEFERYLVTLARGRPRLLAPRFRAEIAAPGYGWSTASADTGT
jgi:hypothetical protein